MAELPEIRSPVVAAIEAARQAAEQSFESWRLGIGSVGDECERRPWYAFRWSHAPERHTGQQLRLFATGTMEERRLIEDLVRAGVTVAAVDPATGKQFEILLADGHMRGKADGRLSGVPGAEKTEHLLECKSHNDRSFKELKKKGLKEAKPDHHVQCQLGMHGLGLTRCLYLAVNKNDDEIYAERIKYDAAEALAMIAKAERIVAAHRAPAKLHEDPDAKMAWKCRSCPALGICHQREFARRNCRTCLHATPIAGGKWTCARFDRELTIEDQKAGCAHHLYLPALVPGEQIDAAGGGNLIDHVTYRLPDGGEWRDGMQEAQP